MQASHKWNSAGQGAWRVGVNCLFTVERMGEERGYKVRSIKRLTHCLFHRLNTSWPGCRKVLYRRLAWPSHHSLLCWLLPRLLPLHFPNLRALPGRVIIRSSPSASIGTMRRNALSHSKPRCSRNWATLASATSGRTKSRSASRRSTRPGWSCFR